MRKTPMEVFHRCFLLGKDAGGYHAADDDGKAGIGMDMGGTAKILFVIILDGAHDSALGTCPESGFLCNVFQKMILEGNLIFPMIRKILTEMGIMGGGECVRGIVDQFAQGIVTQKSQLFLAFKPAGKPCHKGGSILIIMTPKPLAAERSLKIGGGISVRLNAAK